MLLTTKQVRRLQWYVRSILIFGIATSVTANVIHSLTQPHGQAWQTWSSAGLAALAPIVLFLTSEMVVRIPLHSPVLGWFRLIITLGIAGFSAWISYWHMVEVSVLLGETSGSQFFYPLIIDGMMIVATISLMELGRLGAAVLSVEVKAEGQKAEARRCKPGCTCKRHVRKAPAKRKRVVKTPATAPVSPGHGPVESPSVEQLENAVR